MVWTTSARRRPADPSPSPSTGGSRRPSSRRPGVAATRQRGRRRSRTVDRSPGAPACRPGSDSGAGQPAPWRSTRRARRGRVGRPRKSRGGPAPGRGGSGWRTRRRGPSASPGRWPVRRCTASAGCHPGRRCRCRRDANARTPPGRRRRSGSPSTSPSPGGSSRGRPARRRTARWPRQTRGRGLRNR